MAPLLNFLPWRRPGAVLQAANDLAAAGRTNEAIHALRTLSVEDFGQAFLGVSGRFPALAAALPDMPPERVQRDWTGNSGAA
jgi:hypothetical protein